MTGNLRRGFTLVEVLIALTILGLIATLGYRAVVALVDGEVALTAEADRWRSLDALFARLEADLRQALPREVRYGSAREPAWQAGIDADGNSEIRLSRAGPEFDADPGAAGQRIGYRCIDQRIELAYWPRFDQPAATEATRFVLATGIAGFRASFLDQSGSWRRQWPGLADAPLPRAVRLELALTDGTQIERLWALR